MGQTSLSPFPLAAEPQPTVDGSRRGRGVLITFLVLWVAWSALVGWIRVTNPGLDHGDITTDANILNAGENFDREGFWASWGVPALDTFRAEHKTPDYYITYPPGCYWLHQGLKQVSVRAFWHFRLVSVVWSTLAALLFFVLCTRVSGAVLPAAVAATAYMLSRPFGEYADNLHYLSFSQVTLFATLLAWVAVEQAQTAQARMRWLLLAAAMFALDSLVTFEHTLFVAVFGLVRIVLSRRWGLLLPLLLLGLVPVGVLAARFAINAAAMGGVADVWTTMQAKLRQRTGAAGGAKWIDLTREMLDRLGLRSVRSAAGSPNSEVRVGVLSPAFLAPMFVLSVISLATWHLDGMKPARKAAGLALALLLGGVTWSVAMREHALVHRYTILLLLPGIAATIGALVTFGWWQWRLQPRGAPVRMAGVVAGCVLLAAHFSQLRHSHMLNIKWKLDPAVHERDRSIKLFETRFDASRPDFASVKRMYMYSHDAQLGRKLGFAFDNDVGKVHAPLAAGEGQMVMWQGAAQAMLDMEAAAGPPRVMAEPAGHLAFFFAGRETLGDADMSLADGTRVTRLWAELTLDGTSIVVGTALMASKGSGAAGLAMHIRILDADGKVLEKRAVFAEQRAAVTDTALVWVSVGLGPNSKAAKAEIWFTREGRGRLSVRADGIKLPVEHSAKLGADGRTIVLEFP